MEWMKKILMWHGYRVLYEIPFIAKQMAETGEYDAVIGLGTVIRGSTTTLRLCM